MSHTHTQSPRERCVDADTGQRELRIQGCSVGSCLGDMKATAVVNMQQLYIYGTVMGPRVWGTGEGKDGGRDEK